MFYLNGPCSFEIELASWERTLTNPTKGEKEIHRLFWVPTGRGYVSSEERNEFWLSLFKLSKWYLWSLWSLQVDRNMLRLSEKNTKTYQHIFWIFLDFLK